MNEQRSAQRQRPQGQPRTPEQRRRAQAAKRRRQQKNRRFRRFLLCHQIILVLICLTIGYFLGLRAGSKGANAAENPTVPPVTTGAVSEDILTPQEPGDTTAPTILGVNKLSVFVGSVLAAGGFAVFFGGSLIDGAVAALFALLICALQEKLLPISMNQLSFNLICSVIVGVLTGICTNLLTFLHMDKIMIGYIMLLIPGLAMTNAVRNVLVGNTISGIMRLIEAVLWATALALGFMIAMFLTGGAYAH